MTWRKRSHPLVLKRLQAMPVGDVCLSMVAKAELLYGDDVSPRRAQDAAALAAFLRYVEVMEFDDGAALHYAEVRADLKKRSPDRRVRPVHLRRRQIPRVDAGHEQHRSVRAREGLGDRELGAPGTSQALSIEAPRPRAGSSGRDTQAMRSAVTAGACLGGRELGALRRCSP